MLSRPIQDIASTNLFVNDLGEGVHGTVYSMVITAAEPVAMLLPVPVQHGTGEDAVEFVDLSSYPEFFKDMDKLFNNDDLLSAASNVRSPRGVKRLTVHAVGAFKASYVPTLDDFGRLDPQFRFDPTVWTTLPDYGGYGFAVFQFDPGSKKRIHPMAYRYPVDKPSELFFPTVHVHDGHHADRTAHFDHKLYYQYSDKFAEANGWTASNNNPDWSMTVGKAGGMVRNKDQIYRRRIKGMLPNADQILVNDGSTLRSVERSVRVA